MSEQTFLEQRAALIEMHSKHDTTFAALQRELETENSFSSEYWRWRIDQYLYGQYNEYQPIYDAYTEGKAFNEIYDLPAETVHPASEEPAKLPEIPDGFFTDNLPGNVRTGWTHLADGKISIAYQGYLTDPYIASYDLENDKWDGPYKAGHSTLSKNGRRVDSHGRPALEQDSDGYFHIVFGGHGGEREDGLNPFSIDTPHAGGRQKHVVSERPNDISSFLEKDDITPFASYTAMFKMGNGDIYFFTRAGTHKSPWMYYKMKSGSQTFEPPVFITWPVPRKDNPIDVDTFYLRPKKVSDTEIIITYLGHICNFKEVHDRTHYSRINTYYMKMDTTNDSFYNVENKKLSLPLTRATSDELTLAYDSEKNNETCFSTRPLVLEDGRPAAAYEAMGPDYREWRMTVYEDGSWTHSLPIPGTQSRSLKDAAGNEIERIQDLEIIEGHGEVVTAAVLYENEQGESVFAIAKSSSATGAEEQDWIVQREYFTVSQSRLAMQAVRDEAEKAIALVLNVRKGASQRLYLWYDGEFRPNNSLQ